MALKYNAFISYRHSELDSKIASEVQTRLERFRIPKAIVKKTGIKRFERIFRDKEELPITSDLNDDIEQALANSDNLIVICSTRTSESVWVLKEIETFLKYHDKKHIFTVLADGEPEEVIPDILMHDTVTRMLPNGTVETREEYIEPLSCDYRMDIKKARKIELPRLAAPMIGCSYDELIQRRRQYIRRRNSIIGLSATAMLAAIIGYLTWSLLKIQMNYDLAQSNFELAQQNLAMAEANLQTAQENYMESLRNQSVYLASESAELLNAGDRLGAVQLALAALPSESFDRPITSEAEFALANALGVYLTPGLSDSAAMWNYGSGYRIEKFRIDPLNLRVASLDTLGNLNIWSLEDHTLLKTFISERSKLYNFFIAPGGRPVLAYSDEIRVIDSDLETELWSMPIDNSLSASSVFDSFRLSDDGSELLYYAHGKFVVIDFMTGEEKLQYDINDYLEDPGEYAWGLSISKVAISPDNSKIALVYNYNLDDKGVVIFDRETEEWILLGNGFSYIPDIAFSPDSQKLIFSAELDVNNNSYAFSGMQVLKENERLIYCYDTETGKQLWVNSISHTLVGYENGMMVVKCGQGDSASDAVAVSFSNRCVIIDLQTGEKLTEKELLSEYIDAYLSEDETTLYFILRNGQLMQLDLEDPESAMLGYGMFGDRVEDSSVFTGTDGYTHYLIQNDDSNYLTEYSSFFYDTGYNPILETGIGGIRVSTVSGKRLLGLDGDMNLYCVDMTTGNVVWTTKVEGDNYTAVKFLGSDEFGNVYMNNSSSIDGDYGDKLYKIDMSSGDINMVADLDYSPITMHTDYVGDCIYISYSGGYSSNPYILKYNTSDGSSEEIELDRGDIEYMPMCDLYVSGDGKYAVLVDTLSSNGVTYLANLETGTIITLDITGFTFASWSPDSEWVAISNGETVNIYEAGGPRAAVISGLETAVSDVFVCEKGILVMMDNGLVGLYDKDGNMTGSLDAFRGNISSALIDYTNTSFEIYDDILIINFGDYSSVIYLDDFKVKTIIAGLLGFDSDSEKLYVRIYGNIRGAGSMGYFKIRSIEDLIAEGIQFVGDAEMTTDMKKRYGIED